MDSQAGRHYRHTIYPNTLLRIFNVVCGHTSRHNTHVPNPSCNNLAGEIKKIIEYMREESTPDEIKALLEAGSNTSTKRYATIL
ncbi:MAG: hypothetical protein N3E47_00530 [Candidatus Bathyarchaeota archaeon]|nr:hypothetical protein [Candidatus Bathyarchaeota archaeon]